MKINFKEIFLIPNLISLFRLLLFIPFYFLLTNINVDGNRTFVAILIFVAFASDLLDGFIARKTNSISELGKIIDPFADKTLIALILIILYLNKEITTFYLCVVILRDVLIILGGIVLSNKIDKILPSNVLGKVTVFSIGAFILLNVFQVHKENIYYNLFYYVSLCLCVVSFFGYLIRALEIFNWKNNENIFTR